eukprot:gnl/Chilomastix_caulleri/1804.p1 GENE.gnl/Chilomastix_caulleri/1804~~gnl/Chilomastix_caulleri/1804.p1  ORF type:complete len:137 (+),score=32.38 gnl/Chilomastix_caulleri/1804:99-509(+)
MELTFSQITDMIKPYSNGMFATIDGDKPDVRGWQLQFIEDGKFYFCTSTMKNVYKQMQENPNVTFHVESGEYVFRISGKAILVIDDEENKRVHEHINDSVKEIYSTPDSNGFTSFHIDHGIIKYAKGYAPSKTIEF